MRTANPVLNPRVFEQQRTFGVSEAMTVQGTVNKCFILFFLLLLSAGWIWGKIFQPSSVFEPGTTGAATANVFPLIAGGGIVGFVLAIVTCFKPNVARWTAPLYALCEGLVLGGVSAIFEMRYPGLVVQSVALTFGVFFCMLALYKSGVIKVTNKFILGVVSATGAVALLYFVNIILGFFGIQMPFLYQGTTFGIVFSIFVVGLAAFNLVIDFYTIEEGSRQGAHKHMEWYAAFALMVTLIWLYFEVIRLLAKMRDRR